MRVSAPPSPLLATAGAVPGPDDTPDSTVAWHYGDPLGEQRTAEHDVGLVDRSHRSVLTITGAERLTGLARVLMWGGALASLIGIALYVLPVELTNRILSTLSPFGYPAGNVVRYVEDDPANYQRAIATAIDPNALGGMLAMVGALLIDAVPGFQGTIWRISAAPRRKARK